MGMPIIVDVRDDDVAGGDLDPVFDWLTWVDATFSTFKPEQRDQPAEPRRADARRRGPGGALRCSSAARSCASRPLGLLRRARGAPGLIDPSGLVKGWSVDRAAALLDRAGSAQLLDQRGRRRPLSGRRRPRLRVARRHPASAAETQARRRRRRSATARSPPRAPTSGASTCSIPTATAAQAASLGDDHGPDLATADAYATAAFAMGAAGPGLDRRLRGYEALTILADNQRALDARVPARRRRVPLRVRGCARRSLGRQLEQVADAPHRLDPRRLLLAELCPHPADVDVDRPRAAVVVVPTPASAAPRARRRGSGGSSGTSAARTPCRRSRRNARRS